MKQEEIRYSDIMSLGFKEDIVESDEVYFDDYGYHYAIITKWLTNKIYLDWSKETRLCKMVRIDNKKQMNIQNEMKIANLDQLKICINFFCNKKNDEFNYTNLA